MAKKIEIPEDLQLPQLQTVIDAAAMKEILQHRLPGFAEGRLILEELVLEKLHYVPGRICLVNYRLHVADSRQGRRGTQKFFGVLASEGTAGARFREAQDRLYVTPEFGPPVHFVPELQLMLWGFPNDPVLTELPRLLQHDSLQQYFQAHWESLHLPREAALEGVETELVKHAPADRCTFRHRLLLAGGGDLVVYSKMFEPERNGALVFHTIAALWQAPVCRNGELIVPEPLFFAPELNTIFVRGLAGTPVEDMLAGLDLEAFSAQCGTALAGVHTCRIEGLPIRTADHELALVASCEEILYHFDESFRPRLGAIVQELLQRRATLPVLAPVPIHSAFRLTQLLVVAGKPALVDFDDFCLSHPLTDVGGFLAHLLYLPLKGGLGLDQCLSAARHFCRAYASHAPWGLPGEALQWQTAVHLVCKQVKKCVRRTKENYHEKVDYLLDLAEQVLFGRLVLFEG